MEKLGDAAFAVARACACVWTVFALSAGAVTVDDIEVKTHYPWNGLVDVTYTVSGIDPARGFVYDISASIATGATETVIYKNVYTTNIADNATAVSFTWDATAAGYRGRAEDAKVVFTVAESAYLVIDLSSGPQSTKYPVGVLAAPFTDVTHDYFKTNSLLLKRVVTANEAITNYVGVYEVTQRQYELVTGENPSYYALYSDPTVDAETRLHTEWKRPVERISYAALTSTNGFFGRLWARTGLKLGLPTTNEWQAVARGAMPESKLYNLGPGEYKDLTDKSWLTPKPFRYGMTGMKVGNRNCSDKKGTAMVGSYAPNEYGLYDMHGNVSEWTRSIIVDVGLHQTTTNGVLCGGDYVSSIGNCAVTSTRAVSQTDGSRYYYTGFRVFGEEESGYFNPPVIARKGFTLDVATLPRKIRVKDDAGTYTFFYTPTNGTTEIDWVSFDDAATVTDWKPSHDGINEATNAADHAVIAQFDVAPLTISLTSAPNVTNCYDRLTHAIGGPTVAVPSANCLTNYWCDLWSGHTTEETAADYKPVFSNADEYVVHYKVTSPFYTPTNATETLTITAAVITAWTFNPKPGQKVEYIYNSSNQPVKAAYVKAGGLTLDPTEYALSNSNATDVGVYTSVVHTISSNFSNPTTDLEGEWKISPFDISGKEVVVLCQNAIVSNGYARTIEDGNITNVTCKGLVLKSGEYSFESNPQVCTGTYWTVMNASGNFTGSQSIRWEIKPAPAPVLASLVPAASSPSPTTPSPALAAAAAAAATATAVTVSAVDIQALSGGSVQVTVLWTPGVTAGVTYTLVGKKLLTDETWTPLASFTAEADSEAEADRRITVTTSEGYQFFTVEVK